MDGRGFETRHLHHTKLKRATPKGVALFNFCGGLQSPRSGFDKIAGEQFWADFSQAQSAEGQGWPEPIPPQFDLFKRPPRITPAPPPKSSTTLNPYSPT